ncbi:hypothetical protein EYF80_051979 [Liparis tanakae]|uniref:Uncharacterized protein n=1 Tax=Liparis tanakae TaxID=230148 RepID=A0A4Z2FAQ6_9TELE|nr:hypothetical protein EYF80_051979 [Liparis tanakae]
MSYMVPRWSQMTEEETCRPMFWLNLSRMQIMWKWRFTPGEKRLNIAAPESGRGRSAPPSSSRSGPLAACLPTGLCPIIAWNRQTSTSWLQTTESSPGSRPGSGGFSSGWLSVTSASPMFQSERLEENNKQGGASRLLRTEEAPPPAPTGNRKPEARFQLQKEKSISAPDREVLLEESV